MEKWWSFYTCLRWYFRHILQTCNRNIIFVLTGHMTHLSVGTGSPQQDGPEKLWTIAYCKSLKCGHSHIQGPGLSSHNMPILPLAIILQLLQWKWTCQNLKHQPTTMLLGMTGEEINTSMETFHNCVLATFSKYRLSFAQICDRNLLTDVGSCKKKRIMNDDELSENLLSNTSMLHAASQKLWWASRTTRAHTPAVSRCGVSAFLSLVLTQP